LEGTSISETFQVEGLTSMIRATRGRSMDGWVDWSVGRTMTTTNTTSRRRQCQKNGSKQSKTIGTWS